MTMQSVNSQQPQYLETWQDRTVEQLAAVAVPEFIAEFALVPVVFDARKMTDPLWRDPGEINARFTKNLDHRWPYRGRLCAP